MKPERNALDVQSQIKRDFFTVMLEIAPFVIFFVNRLRPIERCVKRVRDLSQLLYN